MSELAESLSNKDRIAILGANRGLGWAVYQQIVDKFPEIHFLLVSRKISERQDQVSVNTVLLAQDFSKVPVSPNFLAELKSFNPTRIIYVAGGGPYGVFQEKKWADHLWALNTTFLYPCELLHAILHSQSDTDFATWADLTQMTFVGSQIAESNADPMAASYAAAKHGLKGLISTIQAEGLKTPSVLLFSPGYMQTGMLPAHSWPVVQGLAEPVALVAKLLVAFIEKNNQR